MDFGILGPLEIRHEGRGVTVPGRHAPKLLAVLLLEAGRLVTVDRLGEVLWPKDPPATARRQVQNVMAGLRRALPEPDAIEVGGNGYRLRLDGNTVDHREFRRLRTAARRADPAEALRLLRQALGLWRGPALTGLTGGLAEAATIKLGEERLAAVEERVALELELAEDTDVIGELRDLLRDNPYRQRAVLLLMRALWRDDRADAALVVYERLRHRLAEELGLDPDAEVVRLGARIRGEDAVAPRPPISTGPVPAQLPAAPSTFTGRVEQLAELDDLLEQGHDTAVVSAIAGMGGAGKTALALRWGHGVRDRFPDGQLYINLRGYDDAEPVTSAAALGRFLIALGRSSDDIPTDVDEAAAVYRSLLAGRRTLVVLDNARSAEQVRPLLPGGAGNFALVTSRDRLAGLTAMDDAVPIRLDTLSEGEALELLANIVGARRVRAEPQQSRRIVELCGRLPLALRIAGAHLGCQPGTAIAHYAERLADNRLKHLAIDGDPRAAVGHTLQLSVDAIDAAARALLLRAAMFPGADFSRDLAVRLPDLDEPTATTALNRLVATHLVEEHSHDRYRFHDLTREYARDRGLRTVPAEEIRRVQTRCIDWYDGHINSLLAEEGANAIATLEAWHDHPLAWKLVVVASSFWRKGHSATSLLELCLRWLPAARAADDAMAVPRMHNSIAILYRGLGRKREAMEYARRALTAAEATEVGDRTGKFHGNLAIFIDELGRVGESVPLFREALRRATEHGIRFTMTTAAAALGNAHRILGEFTEAEHRLRQAIDLVDPATMSNDVDVPRFQLGVLWLTMGRYDDAVAEFDVAIAAADRLHSIRYQILARVRRADAARRRGETDDAQRLLAEAIELSVRNEHDSLAVTARLLLTELLCDMGRQTEADQQLRLLPDAEPDETDVELRADLARVRGLVAIGSPNPAAAVAYLEHALSLYVGMPSPLLRARVLAELSSAHRAAGQPDSAERRRTEALAAFNRLGVPDAALAAPPPG